MTEKNKSILEGMEVKESGSSYLYCDSLQVIGSCPKCGNPIYGKINVGQDEQISVKRTCDCGEIP